ncbi:helix-turn-helix domain-containing protein [Alkalicella caledoniensis]|uniref:Helix-turn-helix domain-containing protein n=1 Tax=Alkalicella caledoniensis TaxID=2731377 RepID=A0A7G9W6G8_ALKCA|nr:helix-turn-helix domain-containing protein [Alkalicella caledoniensis]QNO14280.1 helix-turn-helix domain-containing protein [Alkalicella caledoniensis]
MKAEGFNAHSKHMVLKHALKENNVSNTCNLFGISRTTFYNWYRAYEKYGISGLENKEPKKPKMPNKVSENLEHDILAYVERYPADGPKRIYYELKAEGFDIGESGIYNVLKRNNLSKKAQRIAYSKSKVLHRNIKPKNSSPTVSKNRNQKAAYPCHYVLQRIEYIGKFDGIGKVYQYYIYDVNSKLGVAKLYNKKKDIDPWYFFELKILYLLRTFNLKMDNLFTEKAKEYTPYFVKGNRGKELIEQLNVKHNFIEHNQSPFSKDMDEFKEFLVKEFYSKIVLGNNINSFSKLEREFYKFLRYYNFTRPIPNGRHKGKVPAEIVLEKAAETLVDFDTLPLWILALLNQPKGGTGNAYKG